MEGAPPSKAALLPPFHTSERLSPNDLEVAPASAPFTGALTVERQSVFCLVPSRVSRRRRQPSRPSTPRPAAATRFGNDSLCPTARNCPYPPSRASISFAAAQDPTTRSSRPSPAPPQYRTGRIPTRNPPAPLLLRE